MGSTLTCSEYTNRNVEDASSLLMRRLLLCEHFISLKNYFYIILLMLYIIIGNMKLLYLLCLVAASVSLAVSDCNVVPIEEWASSKSNRFEKLAKPVNLVIIQHTVTNQCFTDADCQKIANYVRDHQMSMEYSDIGISFLVGGNGKLYEGAGWRVGAHTRGYNDKSISISFVGDFRTILPSSEALQAALDFLNCAVQKNNLSKNYNLVGHQQLTPTLSPGAKLQSLISTWAHWKKDISQI